MEELWRLRRAIPSIVDGSEPRTVGRNRIGWPAHDVQELGRGVAMIVDTAQRAAELLAPFFESPAAGAVAVLHLDADRRLLTTTYRDRAGGHEIELPIRDILATALRLGSAAIIAAHNHPGGEASPSEQDRRAARRLAEAAAAVDIRLLDHLVFAGDQCRSFRELGLL
jgi:DNA repair protein RadC